MSRSFDRFTELLPPDPDRIDVSDDTVARYQSEHSEPLIDFWKAYGFGGFGHGLLWFFDPDWLLEEARRYPGMSRAIPFARTALGNFYSLVGKQVHMTNVELNMSGPRSPSLLSFGSRHFFHDPKDIDILLMRPLKEQAEAKLGPISRTRCYGYKLALALGGAEEVDNLQINELEVYLSLLNEIHGNPTKPQG